MKERKKMGMYTKLKFSFYFFCNGNVFLTLLSPPSIKFTN